jgi:hypothetical protein
MEFALHFASGALAGNEANTADEDSERPQGGFSIFDFGFEDLEWPQGIQSAQEEGLHPGLRGLREKENGIRCSFNRKSKIENPLRISAAGG